MKYIVLVTSVFLIFTSIGHKASAQGGHRDTLIRILSWGLPNFSIAQEETQLAAQWGFYFDQVADCSVTGAEIDSLKRYNELAGRPLVLKYGKDWSRQFQRKLAAITATPIRSCELFHYDKAVSSKREQLQAFGDTLFYHFEPTGKPGIYNVDIVGWYRSGTQKKWVSFLRYHVNYVDGKATLTREKVVSDPSYVSGNIYYGGSL